MTLTFRAGAWLLATCSCSAVFLPAAALGQSCLGVPLRPGQDAFGGRFEFGSPISFYGAAIVHEGRVVSWEGHGGARTDDFPEDLEPAFGGSIAVTGVHSALCPAASITLSWPESESFALVPGDVTESRQSGTVGIGIGQRRGEGAIGFAPYAYPHLLWTRHTVDTPDFDEVTTDTHFAIDIGAGLGGAEAWIGGGLRFILPDAQRGEDIPGTAILLRGGVIF